MYGVEPICEALQVAPCQPSNDGALIHHSDRGSQYVRIRYSERLAETINVLYKAELIHRRAPWKTRQFLELAILE